MNQPFHQLRRKNDRSGRIVEILSLMNVKLFRLIKYCHVQLFYFHVTINISNSNVNKPIWSVNKLTRHVNKLKSSVNKLTQTLTGLIRQIKYCRILQLYFHSKANQSTWNGNKLVWPPIEVRCLKMINVLIGLHHNARKHPQMLNANI